MRSIRGRLLCALLAGCLLVMGCAGWVAYLRTRDALLAEVDARLRVQALAIVQQTYQERDHEHRGKTVLDVFFAGLHQPEYNRGGTEYFQVWRSNGETQERSESLAEGDLPRQLGTLTQPLFWSLRLPDGQPGRAIGIEFVPNTWPGYGKYKNNDFKASLVVAIQLGHIGKTLATLQRVLWSVGGIAFVTMLLSVPWMLWHGFQPLNRLSAGAAQINAERLNYRFSDHPMPSELQPIVHRLNELLARLENSFERERRFSSDVAHELRTPIAELRSLAEVALKWPPDSAGAQKVFGGVLDISQRLESLVTGLLAIARCEAGARALKLEPINLSTLARSLGQQFAPAAAARGIRLEVQAPDELTVHTDPAILQSILTNLVANAVEYTPSDGIIQAVMKWTDEQEGNGAVVEISNGVEQLSPEDVPHLFERFWRKDQSRTNARHRGLGLAVVKAAAQALDLKVEAVLEGRMLLMRVRGLKAAGPSS